MSEPMSEPSGDPELAAAAALSAEPDPYPPARGVGLVVRAVVAAALLALGVIVMMVLVKSKPSAARKETETPATPVEVVTAHVSRQRLVVTATGVVMPARQVVIGAEVPGRVVSMSPELVPGGRFRQGQPVIRVDARDYQLAAAQQAAQVTIARTELEVEKSRKRVAEREWQLLGEQPPAAGSLALRDPQLQAAEGAVKAAESGLDRTRLAVSKTGVAAPFNALVLTRNVDLGQIVAPGQPLASLVGTDAFWIQVSVPMSRVPTLKVPGMSGATTGSAAHVRQRVGDRVLEREGRVVRMAGDLDPVGRMARVIVEVLDPLALASPGKPPLLLNSFVEVELDGDEVDGVVEIPRVALRDDDRVWTMEGGALVIREVEVIWRRRATVVVTGLDEGAQVIVSPVATPAAGLKVRVVVAPVRPPSAPHATSPAEVPAPAPATQPTPKAGSGS